MVEDVHFGAALAIILPEDRQSPRILTIGLNCSTDAPVGARWIIAQPIVDGKPGRGDIAFAKRNIMKA